MIGIITSATGKGLSQVVSAQFAQVRGHGEPGTKAVPQ
jgi:hypothetical protein